ncbi:unnamed protein product [Rotaria sp. Silwood2]|nr:unnamed protein product [Rotaria sp. Silwood2]CAF2544447.1 unnamed protein product [Rotaria sp. Silwood2]CAF2924952.1 unnamed protein product [Rotaria sp. Silwood2]CAF3293820.1 unnamed protein product [Rotaria sp. Silwood2]CAF3850728.1 unnamed protein product [Rotaria sp. Silwood2]
MTRIIESENFIALWKSYDDVWISTNGVYITAALRNPFVNSSRLLGRLPLAKGTQQLLFPFLFELLFKPTRVVSQGVEQILRTKHKQLTCLHIRLGKNPSNPLDPAKPARINMTRKMLDFLYDNPSLASTQGTLIFVSSDSDRAITEVRQHFPNSSITVPGPIMHIDHHNKKTVREYDKKKICAGLVKALTDFYVLGECQVILLSYSGFSAWANRRRSNPNDKLFMYYDRLGTIRRATM